MRTSPSEIAEERGAGPPAPPGPRRRPVHVCFLIDRLFPGGTESQLLKVMQHVDRERVRPHLVLLDGEDAISRSLEPADIPVLRLGVRQLRSVQAVKAAGRLARFLRRERIDILQPYFPDSTYFGILVGRLAGVSRIVRTRNNSNHWMSPVHRTLGRYLNRCVSVTLCNSEAARRAVLADERPDPGSVVVIENGVDLERFEGPVAGGGAASVRPEGHRVGVVANLRPVKGLDVFVAAAGHVAASVPGATFHVTGNGPERPVLERQVAALGLAGRFELAGSIADVPAFLAGLDVAVLPSRSEGMSNTLLEYMAAGRAIVATAVGGNLRLIEDGIHGLLVPPDDPAGLAGAVVRLIRDPDLATRLATEARRRVRREFDRRAMVLRLEQFYEDLVRG